jgi:beta-1,4-mannosyltransferase
MVSLVRKTTIACLPVAGPGNPYQHLMMDGLNAGGRLHAFNGVHDKFFGIARTVLKYRPNYLHFDWIISYYYRRWAWLTGLSVLTFCAQIILARLVGVRLVWTLHNLLPHDQSQLALHRFCQRFLARRCAWIRVFGESTVQKAAAELRVSEAKFRVVPEGDYTKVYPNRVTPQAARAQLGLPEDSRVLLYLGLIKPYKGVLELVRMFNELREPGTYLYLAGRIMDTRYGEKVRRELTDQIILRDEFIPESELQYYFNAADLVVLPFQQIENSGSVIMSMGFARPVVAPRQGVLEERLRAQPEWLYSSAGELREKLKKALTVPSDQLDKAGIANFKALSAYRWEDFADAFA